MKTCFSHNKMPPITKILTGIPEDAYPGPYLPGLIKGTASDYDIWN